MSTLEQKDVDPRAGSTVKKMAITKGLRFALPILLFVVLFSLPVIALAQSGGYDLSWWTVDGGGATFSTGGAYRLGGTIGQPDAGELSGGDYTLYGGFWNRDFAASVPTPISDGKPHSLPGTGFAPGRVTPISAQPAEKAYTAMSDLWLEIPSQKVKANIVGVPQVENAWDVKWLGRDAGWLNGTAFPTWEGNSVLTAHVTTADGLPGPFANLKDLKYGEQILVHLLDEEYVFEVRNIRLIRPDTTDFAFEHLEDHSYLTLITCEGYNPDTDTYRLRRIIRAVLVEVK